MPRILWPQVKQTVPRIIGICPLGLPNVRISSPGPPTSPEPRRKNRWRSVLHHRRCLHGSAWHFFHRYSGKLMQPQQLSWYVRRTSVAAIYTAAGINFLNKPARPDFLYPLQNSINLPPQGLHILFLIHSLTHPFRSRPRWVKLNYTHRTSRRVGWESPRAPGCSDTDWDLAWWHCCRNAWSCMIFTPHCWEFSNQWFLDTLKWSYTVFNLSP